MTEALSSSTEAIVNSLNKFGLEGKLSSLQEVLGHIKNPDVKIRTFATKTAATIIRENLITNYGKLQKNVRHKLALLLESLDPGVIDVISKDLYSENNDRRLNAVQILGLLKKNPHIKDILTKLINDKDVKIRATAVNLLGKIIGPNDFSMILALLKDQDNRVRANTIEALEAVGNKRLVPILLRFRKDTNNRIRGNIIKALFNLGYSDIENELLDMMTINSDLMKASALWVVAQIKISSTVIEDAAGRQLLSENEMVTRNARNALIALSTPRATGYLKYLDLHSIPSPVPD